MKSILNKIFTKIEYNLNRRWLNPFATLWLNVRCLPLSQAVYLPLLVYGRPKFFDLSGKICFSCEVKYGLVRINGNHIYAPSYQGNQSEFILKGCIVFHGRSQIDTGVKLFVGSGAMLEMGDKTKICDMVNVGCYKYIGVGKMSRITHRCQLMDTNYHFVANMSSRTIPSAIRPIKIGRNVWVGNSTTIMGGTIIPDYQIVASNSLVNKELNVPPYSIIGGIPAKLIKTGYRKVESILFTISLYGHYDHTQELYIFPEEIDEEIFLDE